MSLVTGSTGKTEGSVQENLQCTDVHESDTGLAAKVSFTSDNVSLEPLPGATEPLHHHLAFQQQIDLALGKPTLITKEMHRVWLKKGDEALANYFPEAPQITVTAVEI